ncbi:MAG: hypothetical protein AB7P21_15220 [Lautropia sp.]
MKALAFVVLMFITVGAVSGAAWVGERWFAPGLERGIVMAVLAGFVVFPIARWFEHKGWISGSWRLSKDPADNPPATRATHDPAADLPPVASGRAGVATPPPHGPADPGADAPSPSPAAGVAPSPSQHPLPPRGEAR